MQFINSHLLSQIKVVRKGLCSSVCEKLISALLQKHTVKVYLIYYK